MPTYVYQCSSCSNTFEAEQRITEAPLDSCSCGATGTVKRLIQPIAVMFKGSGFHINDYSGAAGPAAKTEAPSEAPACTGEPSTCACSTPAVTEA